MERANGRSDAAPLRIDGAQGEGGGQLVRTALALSALTGRSISMHSVRAGRSQPGLLPQHLAALTALGEICGAQVEGARLGSQSLLFAPGPVRPGEYRFAIGTAGSAALVLQAILPPLALAEGPSRVTVVGGTHVPWSPPIHYLSFVLLPALAMAGVEARLTLTRWGFYPQGGGEVFLEVKGGAQLRPLTLVRAPAPIRIQGLSAVSRMPRRLAERQRERVLARLAERDLRGEIAIAEVEAADPGSFLFLGLESDASPAGFSALGERGQVAERIADLAADDLLSHLSVEAACDPRLADQLAVYAMAAPGTSRLTTSRISRHLLSVLSIGQQMLGCSVQVSGPEGTLGSVTIEGAGVRAAGSREPAVSAVASVAGPTARGEGLVRKALARDVPAMQALVAHFAAKGELLPRTLGEFYQHLRDFFVCEMDGQLVGICALSLYWEDLAEVRSLAVRETAGGRGLGSRLVEACVAEATALGIHRVFALTYRPTFFAMLGFREIDKRDLPQKIWKDCFKCAKFAACDETALIRETGAGD